jgi:hypothetical protein
MWTCDALEVAMNVVKKTYSLRKVSKSWNILLKSLFDPLNGKRISKKMGPRGVFT